MSTDTGERAPSIDEVVAVLCEFTAKASRKHGHDHKWVQVMRQARDAVTQLRNERDRAYDRLADAIDLLEEMEAYIVNREKDHEEPMPRKSGGA